MKETPEHLKDIFRSKDWNQMFVDDKIKWDKIDAYRKKQNRRNIAIAIILALASIIGAIISDFIS